MSVPLSENEAILMEKLTITINLNIAACWLKLKEFELAKQQCDLVMKRNTFSVKVRIRTVQTLLHTGLKDEAHQDILDAIRYDPNNEELRKEFHKIEQLCTQSREKDSPHDAEVTKLECSHLSFPSNGGITSKSRGSSMEVK